MADAFLAGMNAIDRNAYPTAIQHFQTVLGENPEDPVAHAMIAIALAQVGRRHAALVEARRAVALAPELPIGHVAQAYAHILHDDDKAAGLSFSKALELDPLNRAARLGICRMARTRRDPVRLETALADYRGLFPDDPEADVLKAHLHLMRGETDEAEAAARSALRADPEDADAHAVLGWVHARQGDTAAARERALAALRLAPDDREAHHLLAHAVMLERPLLGYWHRFSLWLAMGGDVRIVAVLIGIWVVCRAAVVLLDEGGMTSAAAGLQLVWVVFVLITWAAGHQYQRMVERELEAAELDPRY